MPTQDGILFRQKYRGLIGIKTKLPIRDTSILSLVYTPGVARPCLEIAENSLASFDYTIRGNTVGIVTDGSSVYGIGNVGAYAAIPMLESKSVFHKTFAGIDAFPIAINTQDVDEFVETVRFLSPTFGGFHLEDISAPRCFEIEEKLKRAVALPIFHTDQKGAAVGVTAALINALKVVDKKFENISVVINGAGAAGTATARMLKQIGVGDIKVCDRHGAIYYRRLHGMNWVKSELARLTNREDKKGSLADMLKGADVFIGFSTGNLLTGDMIKTMAPDPIVFALSLPIPEISYEEAKAAGAKVVATGRSDFPNQVNSSLVFPGIFRGALDVRATDINHTMFKAAAEAMAQLVDENELSNQLILPRALDYRVAAKTARAVAQAAIETGVAQVQTSPEDIERKVMSYVYEGTNAWVNPADENTKGMTVEEES
ncbi:MAG: NADP-dependent malic enzyme, partial [Cyanobacteria bacterium]|nr:NADP-dependent malic enzyme [Cyanobacteriota bacterium]